MVRTRRGAYEPSASADSKPPIRSSSGRKVKNKVGSPAARRAVQAIAVKEYPPPSPLRDCSSDEFSYSEEEDTEEDKQRTKQDEPPSDNSVATGGSRQRLSLNIQRTLVSDIQEAGGIDSFSLSTAHALKELCDRRPDLYGRKGEAIRQRIGRKVQRWKLLYAESEANWLKVVSKLEVTAKPKIKTKAELKQAPPPNPEEAPADVKPAAVPVPSASLIPSAVSFISSSVSIPSAASIPSVSSRVPKMSNPSNMRK